MGMRSQVLGVDVVLEVMVRPRGSRHVALLHGQTVDVDGLARLKEEEDR